MHDSMLYLNGPPSWKSRISPWLTLGAMILVALSLWVGGIGSLISAVLLGLSVLLIVLSGVVVWIEGSRGPAWLAVDGDRLAVRQGSRREPWIFSADQIAEIQLVPGRVKIVSTASGATPLAVSGGTYEAATQLRELVRDYALVHEIPLSEA
jgi:hypothetical protein